MFSPHIDDARLPGTAKADDGEPLVALQHRPGNPPGVRVQPA